MTVQTDNYGIGASGIASQKFTFTAPNDGTFKLGRGVLGAESSFPLVVNADDSISGVFSGLGVGQTETLFTVGSTRINGTTYTNSTGKPIELTIMFSSSATVNVTIAGVLKMSGATGAGVFFCASFIVPNGATYVVNGASVWSELR